MQIMKKSKLSSGSRIRKTVYHNGSSLLLYGKYPSLLVITPVYVFKTMTSTWLYNMTQTFTQNIF